MAKKKRKDAKKKTDIAAKRKKSQEGKTGGNSKRISYALALYNQGDIREAKRAFQKILKKQPANTDALYNLGIIAGNQGRIDDATEYYKKVISIDPSYSNAYFNLGGIFINQAKYDDANEKFQKVVSLSPDYANAWYNLGIIASEQGDKTEALRYYQKVLQIDKNYTNAYYNIGWVFVEQKKYDEAVEYFKKTVLLDPSHADAFFNLGFIALENKNNVKATKYYEKVVKINPNYSLAYNNLGLICQKEHQLDKAADYYKKALSVDPKLSDAYLNMGNLFRARGDLKKAAEYYTKSVDLKSSLVGLNNLLGLQKELCNYDEAYELTLKALEYKKLKKSDLAGIHDTFIQICEWEKAKTVINRFRKAEMDPDGKDVLAGSFMEFCAITDLTVDEIAEQHKKWGELTEQDQPPFEHQRERLQLLPGRKLRIGYSSPDLREHSVGFLIKDIITSHNREQFEIYCYANFEPQDRDLFTQEMINSSTMFKYVKHLSDTQVAEEIYKDKIDILIDLAGHTAGHRLRSFAYKPAPIQITYLGYPNTTGLSRIDYRITDQYAESGRENDYRYSEKLIRLTNCFLGFNGFGDVVPAEIKDNRGEKIIFGCFNNIQKLTSKAVELWARILKAVPNSELHLKAKQLNTTFVWGNIIKEFAKHEIKADRLKCLGYTATRQEHLKLYNRIDIALDTFPYNGTVTTLEALWMNMPVITLVGERHAQRVSYSILKNLDLDQLIAFSEDEYVSKSVELAKRPELVRELKTRMRKNLLASSICNPRVITREMELNFKKIWIEHLNSKFRIKNSGVRSQTSGAEVDEAISAASRLRMAMVKLEAGEFDRAAEISSSLVEEESVSSLAWYLLGVSNYRLGKKDEAVNALDNSLRVDSNNAGARQLLEKIRINSAMAEERPDGLEERFV